MESSGNVEKVKKIQPCKDPITNALFGKLGYNVVFFWIACNATFILTSLYYGTLTKIDSSLYESSVNPEIVPLIEDKSFYIYLILGICGIILINQILKEIPTTFVNFWENNILRSKTKKERLVSEYNRQLEEVEKKINSKKSYIFAVMYVLISSVFIFINLYRIRVEKSPIIVYNDIRLFPLSGIATHATYALLYFLLVIIAYKGILLVFFLRKLHETFEFQANPFHLDGCGGLKPIGDFCIAINYIFFIFFVAIVAYLSFPHSKELDMGLYFSLPSYIFFAAFFFVYPLWPIHETMKEQKNEVLIMLKEKMGPAYYKSLDELIEKGIGSDVETMNTVKPTISYETANIMRTWPFDVSGLTLFLVAASIPVLGVLALVSTDGGLIRFFTALSVPTLNVLVRLFLKQSAISTD